jgi:hypothetical protein
LATDELEDVASSINSVATSSQIRIDVLFSEPLPQETMMITYCVYTNAVMIDSKNKVTTSYANNIN